MRIRLGINVDHVATVRQARRGHEPDPVHAAVVAEQAGADNITAHLREDRRHIQDRDLKLLRQTLHVPLNLEMAATQEMVRIALEVQPQQATLVPERREELTTEGGLDVVARRDDVASALKFLRDGGVRTSLFIEANLQQVKEAKRVGADAVEFHTGAYAGARNEEERRLRLEQLREACHGAARLGLRVHAGHGLNLRNIADLATIAELEEVNIGHAIVARAVFVGLAAAVQEMRAALDRARPGP